MESDWVIVRSVLSKTIYAFNRASWNSYQKSAVLDVVSSDGRMLRLSVTNATKKWCKYYRVVIKQNAPWRKRVVRGVTSWDRVNKSCTVETMQETINRWVDAVQS